MKFMTKFDGNIIFHFFFYYAKIMLIVLIEKLKMSPMNDLWESRTQTGVFFLSKILLVETVFLFGCKFVLRIKKFSMD